jgi:hypothetical protein
VLKTLEAQKRVRQALVPVEEAQLSEAERKRLTDRRGLLAPVLRGWRWTLDDQNGRPTRPN